jgi:hypothetical protein
LLLSAFGGRGSRPCPTKGNRDSVAEAYHRARATTHVSPTRVSAREGVRDGRGSARTRGSSGGRHRSRGSIDRGIRNRARAAESLLTGSLTSRDRHGGREGTSHTPPVRPSDRNAVDHTAARRFSRLARVERVLPARAPPPNDKESPRDKTARGYNCGKFDPPLVGSSSHDLDADQTLPPRHPLFRVSRR